MDNSSHNPTARVNGGPESRQVVNAYLHSARTLPTSRRTRNDHQAFKSLLLIVFFALRRLSPDSTQKTQVDFDDLTQILRRYVATVLAKWGILNPWSAAEDVVQELFVRFLRRNLLKRYDPKQSPLGTYLYGVLRHAMSEAFRKRRRNRTVPLENMMDPIPYHEEAFAMLEIRDEVSAAIGRLSPKLADAIRAELQYGDGAEAAAHLGLKISAFHARTSRARDALREDLKDQFDL
jgi:RNA polymerase sigma factor (sigma-70 family)